MFSLVLGLGNVGERYEHTRHNVGFDVVGRVGDHLKATTQPEAGEYYWAVGYNADRRIVLAQPKTFVNLSGIAAQALLQRNNLAQSEMLVVVDDFNLPLGRLRFRAAGSDGGHNGLASIIETLQSEDFARLRLGIGPLPDGVHSADFVLERPEEEELLKTEKMMEVASEAVVFALGHPLQEAMTRYNTVDPA